MPFRPRARAFSLSVYYVPAVLLCFLKSTNDMSTGVLDQHLQTCKVAQLLTRDQLCLHRLSAVQFRCQWGAVMSGPRMLHL